MLTAWLEFAACAAVIWFAGMRVSRYGDLIADKTGASRTWIGVVMMASVTSLPELFTGISAVGLANTPDIAMGDILGSCVFNLVILAILDLLHGHPLVFTEASRGHVLTAGYGVILIGAVGFGLAFAGLGFDVGVGHISIVTPVLILLYVVSMRGVFRFERDQLAGAEAAESETPSPLTLSQVVTRYVVWAAVVVAAAVWLPFVGARIAATMHWEQSFVGNLFVAFATSLPEIVVTVGCVRQGAIDLAIGNVLGSNLFNILILAIDDIVFVRGPLYASVSPVHVVSAFTGTVMTGVAVVGFLYRPRTRILHMLGWVSMTLVLMYLLNATVLYLYQRS